MKKLMYLIVVIVALGLIIVGCLPTVPPVEQNEIGTLTKSFTTVWVDDDFTVSTPGWGTTHFGTIQDGINAVAGGGIVNVAAGTYNENVNINKSLTLQGEDRETTEIKFGYDSYPSLQPLVISADGVTVSGFTIHSGPYIEAAFGSLSGWAFTIIVDGDSALFTDLHVIKNLLLYANGNPRTGGSAFWLAPSLDGFTLTDSIVESEWNGIYAREDGSDITVRNVDFTYLGTYAIMLKQINGATIEGNIFTNTGNELGLLVSRGCEGIEIMDNKFTGSASSESSHIGILLQDFKTGPVGVSILGNDINDFDTGIKVEENVATSGISIHYNNISGNTTYGVNYLGSDTVDATCNWWGAVDGPSYNGSGSGNAVSDNVDFSPWLLGTVPDAMCCDYNGYGFNAIVECAVSANDHGQFVSCVAHLTKDWFKNGDIDTEEKRAIMNWAAKSDIGKE